MSKCDVCGKESGEYTLCPDCFQEMQEGKLNRCHNCGKWYRKEGLCSCVKTTPSTEPATSSTQEEKNSYSGCLIAAIVAVVLLVMPIIIFALASSIKSSTRSETDTITQITKEKPTLDVEQTNLGATINIHIHANDDYDEVVVELRILDKKKNIISEQYLTKTDLRKGNTYIVSYNLSFSELSSADSFSYKVHKYE